jgi:3-deoxy-D-manno-octulosonate 8-phosphate phosphatase (KDO 8-P phosphatase)
MDSKPFEKIKLVLLDVDGVLTDGSIIYDDAGKEIKIFQVKDGLGIRMLKAAGIHTGIVTGRKSNALTCRCRELGISRIWDGVKDKLRTLKEILEEFGVSADETAYIGDDLPDLSIMQNIGLPIAVADAHREVKAASHVITQMSGGHGAVREICEVLLKAQGKWETTTQRLFGLPEKTDPPSDSF